jgi:hypothetical protein
MVRQVAAKEDKEVERALLRNEEKHIKRMRERAIVSPSEQEFHRKVAVECFNKTWDFLKKKDNTRNDEQLMLNLAHSSRYHWSFVGKAGNFAIGRLADLSGLLGSEPTRPSHTFRQNFS